MPLNSLILGAALFAQAAEVPPQRARAVANLASYVRSGDMPIFVAERGPFNVRVHFELLVTTKGRVGGCRVTRPSGMAELDEITCRIMLGRARFDPARDAEGRAVSDTVSSSISWIV